MTRGALCASFRGHPHYCAAPGSYPGIPRSDARRMNTNQNLARTGRRARHILEKNDLRTSEHVDAIGFHCHSHECVLHEMSVEARALNKAGREPPR
jgi:hypothetical protein